MGAGYLLIDIQLFHYLSHLISDCVLKQKLGRRGSEPKKYNRYDRMSLDDRIKWSQLRLVTTLSFCQHRFGTMYSPVFPDSVNYKPNSLRLLGISYPAI